MHNGPRLPVPLFASIMSTPVIVEARAIHSSIFLDKAQTYHPQFSSQDADIALCSVEGTLFRVHSYALRATSGLFQTIFSLPQPTRSFPSPLDEAQASASPSGSKSTMSIAAAAATTIPIYETTLLLSQMLSLMTGKPPPQPLHSLSLPMLSRLLFLAEKWDTPGPISQIRCVINGSRSVDRVQLFSPCSPCSPFSPFSNFSSSPSSSPMPTSPMTSPTRRGKPGPLRGFFCSDPLRVYVLSRHFQWQDEAERAAMGVLAMTMDELEKKWEDLCEGKVREGQDVEERDDAIIHMVTNRDRDLLIDLRRRRCQAFKDLINDREMFAAGNNPNWICSRCGDAELDNSSWDALKRVMLAELEARPLGDTLLAALVIPPPRDNHFYDIDVGVPSTHKLRKLEDELWPELISCFKARCPNKDCGAVNYDPLATLKQIRICVEVLPWKIKWEDGAHY